LGYKGLIITDDMMMNGATLYAGSVSRAFRMAVDAGNDIVISSTTAQLDEPLWTNVIAAMKTDSKFKEKVKTAARRVILSKLKYYKGKNTAPLYPDENTIDQHIPDKEGQKFFLDQACRSITVSKKKSMPFTRESAGKVLLCGSEPQFFRAGKERWPTSGEFRFSYTMGPNETQWASENILQTAQNYDTIIMCVADQNSATVAQSLRSLSNAGKRVVIFAIMSPVLVKNFNWADTILLGYSYSPYTLEALIGAAAGERQGEVEALIAQDAAACKSIQDFALFADAHRAFVRRDKRIQCGFSFVLTEPRPGHNIADGNTAARFKDGFSDTFNLFALIKCKFCHGLSN